MVLIASGPEVTVGVVPSKETIEKRVSKLRGIPLSEEHKAKLKERKGENICKYVKNQK